MSTQDFDGLAAALANRAISRRRALQLAAASALGAAGLGVAATEAQAHPECPRRGTGCCRDCRDTQKRCACIRTVGGTRRCVYQCCPEGGGATGIGGGLECDENRDCPSGQVCVRRRSCDICAKANPTEPGVCMFKCEEPRPELTECEGFAFRC
jgi:hypothetical protein